MKGSKAMRGFMPDYGPRWWLRRWLQWIWWRWKSRKPPIVH